MKSSTQTCTVVVKPHVYSVHVNTCHVYSHMHDHRDQDNMTIMTTKVVSAYVAWTMHSSAHHVCGVSFSPSSS